jgi:uncharacterized protein YjiS (DUF1127 family)
MKTDGIPRRGLVRRPTATLATAGGGIMPADRKDAATARPGAGWPAAAGPLGRAMAGAARGFGIIAAFVQTWLARRAERRALLGLNDDMLKDIGVSRCDVERELRTRWFR